MNRILSRMLLLTGIALVLLVGVTGVVLADPPEISGGVPPVVSYQGVLTDDDGELLGGVFTMTFQLYDTAGGTTSLWGEEQIVTVTNGLFEVYLGSSSVLTETLFDGQDLYMGVAVGTDDEMSPRLRIPTAPYAFTAGQAFSAVALARSAPRSVGTDADRANGATLTSVPVTRALNGGGMESAAYRIPWSVLSGGGTGMASDNFAVDATLGQPLIGVSQSDSFMISAGYWSGARALVERFYRIYLPLVLRSS